MSNLAIVYSIIRTGQTIRIYVEVFQKVLLCRKNDLHMYYDEDKQCL